MAYFQNQQQNPYNQPVDPIVQRTPCTKRGYAVGMVFRYASGKTCLLLHAIGNWYDIEQAVNGETTIVKVRRPKQPGSKEYREAIGRIYQHEGKWLVDIPLFDSPMEMQAPETQASKAQQAATPAFGPTPPAPVVPAVAPAAFPSEDTIPF